MTVALVTFAAAGDVYASTGTLAGTVVPYGVIASWEGVPITFARGSLELPEDLSTVKLLMQHDQDRPVGYASSALETDTGLDMIFTLADHPRSHDLAAEVKAKLRDGFSIGMQYDQASADALAAWQSDGPPVTVSGQLREVSAVSVPAFNEARASAAAPVATFAAEQPEQPDYTLAELAARVAPLVRTEERTTHPLARFATLADFTAAAWNDPELAAFVLADQITTNNPGVIPPGWLTEVVGIIERGTPGITAFGGQSSLPDSGMDVNWPYFDGDLTALVGEQATQKTQVTSVRVDLKKGTAPLKTYAGGSDISYQLITRSSPSYRDAYTRIMAAAYAIAIDNAFVDAVNAGSGQNGPVWVPGTGTGDQLRSALFTASSLVLVATGSPATFVLCAADVFPKIGATAGLYPVMYGTNNVSGTADAGSLAINVAGLPVISDANLAAGTIIVSNETAASWHGNGPFTVSVDDVSKLGQNVAVWGMGAAAIYLPLGIVKIPAA